MEIHIYIHIYMYIYIYIYIWMCTSLYRHKLMDSTSQNQIPGEVVCISFHPNFLRKGMNPSLFYPTSYE